MLNNINSINHYLGNTPVQTVYFNDVIIFTNDAIRLVIDTSKSSPTNWFALPLSAEASYNFSVNWGDGSFETLSFTGSSQYTHTYPVSNQVYIITITPTQINGFPIINFNNNSQVKNKLISVLLGTNSKLITLENAFYGCSNLSGFNAQNLLSAVNLNNAWRDCTSLTVFSATNLPNSTYLLYTWAYCSSLSGFPVITLPKASEMTGTWFNCTSLKTFPNLDLSNVLTFGDTWANCISLANFPAINFAKANYVTNCWGNCRSLTAFNATNFSDATDFANAWVNCTSLTSFPAISSPEGLFFTSTWANCSSLSSFNFNPDTFSKMSDGTDCFLGVTLPTQTWSAILTSISATNINTSVAFHGGNSKRNTAGTDAYNHLTNVKNWIISDQGPA